MTATHLVQSMKMSLLGLPWPTHWSIVTKDADPYVRWHVWAGDGMSPIGRRFLVGTNCIVCQLLLYQHVVSHCRVADITHRRADDIFAHFIKYIGAETL